LFIDGVLLEVANNIKVLSGIFKMPSETFTDDWARNLFVFAVVPQILLMPWVKGSHVS
jgi:hypothetical protein